MNRNELLAERNRLLERYLETRGVERLRIVGKLVVLDEELEAMKDEPHNRCSVVS